MVEKISISRLQISKEILVVFFQEILKSYFDSLSPDRSPFVKRINAIRSLDKQTLSELETKKEQFCLYSLNSFSNLSEAYNVDGTIGEPHSYINANISLFFIGSSSQDFESEDLSYDLYEKIISFLYSKGGSFVFHKDSYYASLVFSIPPSLELQGFEKNSENQMSQEFFISYLSNITPRITIHFK